MTETIGFIGFGLIGGSIARAIKENTDSCHIIVYSHTDTPSEELLSAQLAQVADELVTSLSALQPCDYVFLCAPVDTNISYLPVLSTVLKDTAIITDVGSVKRGIMDAAIAAGLSTRFVGGHPMTGSERTGFQNSSALLMENAYYAVTATKDCDRTALSSVLSLIQRMKSIPLVLSPEEHDEAVSAISHVPHIIAATLVNLAKNSPLSDTMRTLAAGGFKDITRIASSSPALWSSILFANRTEVCNTLTTYRTLLEEALSALQHEDRDAIMSMFASADAFRSSIHDQKGLLAESFVLYADIKDEAGAIASFASLLANAGISIKNIGIVHNREFERGALQIEFYDKASLALACTLLQQNHCTVYTI